MSTEPLQKKPKTDDLTVPKEEDEETDHTEETKEKLEPTAMKVNPDGTKYFDLSDRRRCTVREYRDEILVDLREVRYLFIDIIDRLLNVSFMI